MDEELQQFISLIEGADVLVQEQCRQRLAASGTADATVSHVAERIAGVAGTLQPEPLKKAVVLFAADHAVDGGKNESKGKNSKADALEIAGGKGAINKVAHRVNAGVLLLDLGLEEDIPESMGVQDLKVMHGSHYYGNGPAMTEDEMLDAFYSGIQIAQNLADEGYTAIGLGNLGERALLTGFIVTAAFYRQKLAGLQGTLQDRNQVKMLSAMCSRSSEIFTTISPIPSGSSRTMNSLLPWAVWCRMPVLSRLPISSAEGSGSCSASGWAVRKRPAFTSA